MHVAKKSLQNTHVITKRGPWRSVVIGKRPSSRPYQTLAHHFRFSNVPKKDVRHRKCELKFPHMKSVLNCVHGSLARFARGVKIPTDHTQHGQLARQICSSLNGDVIVAVSSHGRGECRSDRQIRRSGLGLVVSRAPEHGANGTLRHIATTARYRGSGLTLHSLPRAEL